MSEGPPQLDAKYRPYRGVMWGVYLVFSLFVGLAVTFSVLHSVQKMTPSRPPTATPALDPEACRALAEQLFTELDQRRRGLSAAETVRKVDADWTQFRVKWMNEFRDAEARCDVDAKDRKPTREIFEALEKVADLYTVHAVQFAGEVGPTLDTLRAVLKPKLEARQLPEPGKITP